jgi:hypothetical protein
MCGQVFPLGDDLEARDEALRKGVEVEPDGSNVVCDDCYKLTPWGSEPALN